MVTAVTIADVDSLPPTQYLILEVLAARYRLGEHHWTFTDRCAPAARALEAAGLVTLRSGPAPRHFEARLTEVGRSACLLAGYVPPVHRREPVRVVVVTDWRRGRVYSITADDDQARQDVRDVAARYGNDPLAASMTVWVVDPEAEKRPRPPEMPEPGQETTAP